MTLNQTYLFFVKKAFEITERGLTVKEKNLISASDYFVDFENIRSRRERTKSGLMWLLYLGLGSLGISILTLFFDQSEQKLVNPTLFYLLTGLGLLVSFVFTFKDVFVVFREDSLTGIEFLFNKPSQEEFENFIDKVFEKRNFVLNNKYGQIIPHLPYETNYNNLFWLLNNQVILQDEFNNKIAELNKVFKRTESTIGFGFPKND